MKITNKIQEQNQIFEGSRKIPRYIYHLTNKSKFEAIMKDGFVKMSEPKLHVDNGIYAFDLCNFFSCWKPNKAWGYDDLQRIILRHIVKWFSSASIGTGDLVVLKIPTANLDSNKLFIRSMNKLFTFEESDKSFGDISSELQKHLKGNTPAREAPLYKMRKEAIEFIYKDNIPLENIQQIGNIVNISSLRKDLKFGANPVKCIMQTLLMGTPEVKGVELLG